jgi:hypothetical protein
METDNHLARQDRPIDKLEADALDRGPFITSLIKSLVHTEHSSDGKIVRRATGFVVGLTGEWGLGKSSVLNLLNEKLQQIDGVVVATLNPWLFKGRDELIAAYFNSLREALGQSTSEQVREVRRQLERYKASIEYGGTTIAAIIDALGAGGAATVFWKKWLIKGLSTLISPKDLSAHDERKSLEAKLARANVPVVVLIDELDRVEDDEVRAVAQLIKAVGDIKGISYLVAYDPVRVAQALGRGSDPEERQRTGESYLEKIIQFPISLRPLFVDDVKLLLTHSLRINGVDLPNANEPYQHNIFKQLVGAVRTPREIKRMTGTFAVLEEITRGEICPYDVLGYSWIVAKAPAVRDLIVSNFEAVIDDPGDLELLKRMELRQKRQDKNASVTDILGPNAAAHREILQVLFPRSSVENTISDGKRISKRRNLIRLLYLGNPPGMMTRAEIEQIWSIGNIDQMETAILHLQQSKQFLALFDRLSDLLPELPPDGDSVFWVALSRTLVRQHDWISNEESLGSLVDDAGTIMWRHAKSSDDGMIRIKETVKALIAAGDLLIVPWLLRKHLYAHNLTQHSRPNSGDDVIFGKNETSALLEQELPRYRRAVIDGTALRRLPDMEAVYCIANSKRWDDELRVSLTEQLDNMDAVATFAALTVRPGYVSHRSSMNEMIDVDAVLGVVDRLVADAGLPKDLWLATSVKRLQATLRGLDPSYVGEPNSPFKEF